MEKKKSATKVCKHCKMEIPQGAKVCPQCRKKQGMGCLTWIIIIIVIFGIIGIFAGGGNSSKPKKTGETKTESEQAGKEEDEKKEEVSNVFYAGDIVETEDLKITFISASQYQEENEFMQPKEGFEYWKFDFEFENISDSDQAVSSMMDWECYADNSKADQSWIGDENGLDATLSSGRKASGSVYFEIPIGAESIELEYDINFWQSDKIVFVAK